MSISSEIERIQAAKEMLKAKLNAKNDEEHQITNETLDEFGSFADSIPSGGKNIQYNLGMFVTSYTSYTASGLKLTVNKTGTYTVKWLNRRMSTSGTWQSGLYINKKLYGSYYSNWGMTYYKDYETTPKTSSEWQAVVIEHVELTEGDEIEIYGRSNSNGNWNYYLGLVVEEE